MSVAVVASLVLVAILLLITPLASTSLSLSNQVTNNQLTKLDFSPAPLPVAGNIPVPQLSARNVFVQDLASKTVLLAANADEPVLPASTTKMMTALVALDNFDLADTITVTQSYPLGTRVGFAPGERLSVEQLLYALLIQSANDAAEILAENFPGGRVAFIGAMNNKAQETHLTNTHFTNPTGIDEEGHYSTAADLARLAAEALKHPVFAKIVATENAVVATHVLTNINQLLGKVAGVIGVKTGNTEGAKQALVTLVERDGHPVILVVLGSENRFADTSALIDWVYSNWDWEQIAPQSRPGQ